MGDEAAYRDGASVARWCNQHHLGYGFLAHVAEVHSFADGKADRLDPCLEIAGAVQLVTTLVAGRTDVFGLHHDAGHAVVDQRDRHAVHDVTGISGRQQRAAG